jgi:hypothetical protein
MWIGLAVAPDAAFDEEVMATMAEDEPADAETEATQSDHQCRFNHRRPRRLK